MIKDTLTAVLEVGVVDTSYFNLADGASKRSLVLDVSLSRCRK